MGTQGIAISAGCALAGVIVTVSAITQLRSGTTLSGRGGPSGPITRVDRPGYFWYLFGARAVLGPIAAIAGLAGLAGWL